MSLSAPPNCDDPGPQDRKRVLQSTLCGEINIEPILALDEQIREHESAISELKRADKQIRENETAIAELKRARNSLLNISKLPPEVLGNVFRWNVTFKGDFDGLEERSHNFLLVCRRWSEVASCAPELWSFWGNTPKDWARWHNRSGTTPLDLVLNIRWNDSYFDTVLFNVLQDRTNRGLIRRIHLKTPDSGLLHSIIPSLTADSAAHQPSNVESLIMRNESTRLVDISDFFARHHFPRLQHLELFKCKIQSWNLIISQVAALTTLDLNLWSLDPTPTTSQALSILASNPSLRKVSLCVPLGSGGGGNPPPRVSLRHLRELKLNGGSKDVFGFLDRLDHPRHMDQLDINLGPCAVEDIPRLVGPYLQDYLQHRGGSQSSLGLSLALPNGSLIILCVGDAGGIDFYSPVPARMNPFMTITIELYQQGQWKAALDLISHTPREHVVYFQAKGGPVVMEDISTQLPNLRGLHFGKTHLPAASPRANLNGGGAVFPSLQYVLLDRVAADDFDWRPLTTFLDRHKSSVHTLMLVGPYRIDLAVQGNLETFVKEFAHWVSETSPS